jgi:hypothetical protein
MEELNFATFTRDGRSILARIRLTTSRASASAESIWSGIERTSWIVVAVGSVPGSGRGVGRLTFSTAISSEGRCGIAYP